MICLNTFQLICILYTWIELFCLSIHMPEISKNDFCTSGWTRTSNRQLRRLLHYPLCYGRISCTRGGARTRTHRSAKQILSLSCLPIPPPGHNFNQLGCSALKTTLKYTNGILRSHTFLQFFQFFFLHHLLQNHRFSHRNMNTIVNPHINLFFVSFSTLPHEYTMRILKFHLLR